MPNIKSVKKDVIKSRKNHLRNVSAKSAMKTFAKKARVAMASGDAAAIDASVRSAASVIDKTAERGIIHRNAASRRKSRLMAKARRVLAAQA